MNASPDLRRRRVALEPFLLEPFLLEPFLLRLSWLGQLLLGLSLIAFAGGGSCARVRAQDAPTAEALFEEGRVLMAAGRHAEACPKFEASHRLDPAIGTLLNLGYCYAEIGKVASAWTAYREAASLATWQKQPEREAFARAQAAALEPRIARLIVRVEEPGLEGLEVKRGGSPVPQDAWGSSLPIDPGEWSIEASAPGRKPFATRVVVAPAATVEVAVPALERLPEVPVAAAPAPRRSSAAAVVPTDVLDRPSSSAAPARESSIWPLVGIGVGAAGLVGLGLSAVFALEMGSEDDAARAICPQYPEGDCTMQNVEDWKRHLERAKEYRTLTYVTVSAGAACVVAGAVLLLIAPSEPAARARVSVDVSPSALALRVNGTLP